MLRSMIGMIAVALTAPVLAQAPAATNSAPECLVRANATPTSWLIQGYDPFGGSVPEGTFGVTFTNEGAGDCNITPTFELAQPFGLSMPGSKPLNYTLVNLTESQDITPRTGRSPRRPSQRQFLLKPNESQSILYKLLVDTEGLQAAGTYTQDVTLEAQDGQFRSLGGTRLVLGITVLPSARIGLAGAYKLSNGQALVNLGELREGMVPIPLHLTVNSTGRYDISVTSKNQGNLRLGSSQWQIPYSMAIGNKAAMLSGSEVFTDFGRSGPSRDILPIDFFIGDIADKRAGTYSDVISIGVTAR